MSATHGESDAAVQEDKVALGYDILSQVGRAEGIGRDYQLKCNLSKQGTFLFLFMYRLATCYSFNQSIDVFKKSALSTVTIL